MPPTAITTSSLAINRVTAHRVYLADSLTGEWTQKRGLFLTNLKRPLAPGVDEAVFEWRYGKFSADPDRGPGNHLPLSVSLKWVKVEFLSKTEEVTDRWIGQIEVDELAPIWGTFADGTPNGIQTIVAYGAIRQLELVIVDSAVVEATDFPNTITIPRGLTFNEPERTGLIKQRGNRSADELGEDGTFVFANEPTGGGDWTADDAVRYLIQNHTPQDFLGNPVGTWTVVDQTAGALNWQSISVATDGRSLKSILDEIIDRRRLIGYYVEPVVDVNEEETETISFELRIVSFVDEDLQLSNDSVLAANPNQITIDFETALDVTVASLRNNATHMVDEVVVRGARITSTLSVWHSSSPGAELFAPAWTSEDETAYLAAASGETGYDADTLEAQQEWNIQVRGREQFRDVFSLFQVKTDWDQTHPQDKFDSPGDIYVTINADGLAAIPTDSEDLRTVLDVEGEYGPDPLWLRGCRLLERLPIRDANDRDYAEPFSIWGVTGERWVYGEHLNHSSVMGDDAVDGRQWSVAIKTEPDRFAFRLDVAAAGGQHLIGKSEWATADPAPAATPERLDPDEAAAMALSYTDSIVTVAFEWDRRVEVTRRTATLPIGRQLRRQVIHVPDARLDLVLPGTYLGIDAGAGLNQHVEGYLARDDRPRLSAIADVAFQWFTRKRQALKLTWRQINPAGIKLGDLVTSIGTNYQDTNVRSVVSLIEINCKDAQTSIETSYAELDLANADSEAL